MVAVIAPPKPRFRGRIHQVAFFVSLPAGMVLILLANGPAAIAVASVYAVSLAAVFGSSAIYHRGHWTERARRWMKRSRSSHEGHAPGSDNAAGMESAGERGLGVRHVGATVTS